MITIVQVSQWLNTPTTGAWYSWLVEHAEIVLNHAQSWSIMINHAQSTQFQKFAWWSPSMINPRFLAGNTWKHILGCFNPILVIVYGIASPIFNKLNPFRAPPEQALLWPLVSLRLPADTVSGYWKANMFDLGILEAKKNKNSSHLLDWIITLLAYHKDP